MQFSLTNTSPQPVISQSEASSLYMNEKRTRGRPRKYPEHHYQVVNGKMRYPGAKERVRYFIFLSTFFKTNIKYLSESFRNPSFVCKSVSDALPLLRSSTSL